MVSSIKDRKLPVSFCALREFAFSFLLIDEIINPETGNKTNTNKVNFTLRINIITKEIRTVKGSLTIASKEVRKETSTSCTSMVILAIISPFFFSEK